MKSATLAIMLASTLAFVASSPAPVPEGNRARGADPEREPDVIPNYTRLYGKSHAPWGNLDDSREKARRVRQRERDERNRFERLVAKARRLPAMTEEERREQAASFAFGNMALTREWQKKTPEELAALKAQIRKLAGCKDA